MPDFFYRILTNKWVQFAMELSLPVGAGGLILAMVFFR